MSEEERKQMDEIISRAVKRKEMGKEEGTHFMALHCQVEQYTHESARGAEPNGDEIKQFLREICMKCCEHGCCHFVGNKEEEEDLLFPKESDEKHKEEIRKAVQSGKMAMLFKHNAVTGINPDVENMRETREEERKMRHVNCLMSFLSLMWSTKTFLFFKCPLQKQQGDIPESHPECWKEMVELLESVWNFCQSNECCHFIRYDPDTGDIDDELPFD